MVVLSPIVERAHSFLLDAQDADGLWRDYLLQPGTSTAWTTAVVAAALGPDLPATEAARSALLRDRRASGWGYNLSVATDADTTAWVMRFMTVVRDPCTADAATLLSQFITANGGARTFADRERFGTWAAEHADVTPIVGLALVESRADRALALRLRNWCVVHQQQDGSWRSFWWSTDAYATAKSLELLAASGGIPDRTLEASIAWLSARPSPSSTFEAAHALAAAVHCKLTNITVARRLVQFLCDTQQPDGGWPASKALLVPDQRKQDASVNAFADHRRLMSTAAALLTFKLCLSAQPSLIGIWSA